MKNQWIKSNISYLPLNFTSYFCIVIIKVPEQLLTKLGQTFRKAVFLLVKVKNLGFSLIDFRNGWY